MIWENEDTPELQSNVARIQPHTYGTPLILNKEGKFSFQKAESMMETDLIEEQTK